MLAGADAKGREQHGHALCDQQGLRSGVASSSRLPESAHRRREATAHEGHKTQHRRDLASLGQSAHVSNARTGLAQARNGHCCFVLALADTICGWTMPYACEDVCLGMKREEVNDTL